MMEQPLVLLVSLVLVSFCRGLDWTPRDFCREGKCPEYNVTEQKQDYEEREYAATDWITTTIESTATSHIFAAHTRLKNYHKRQTDAGYEIPDDTWPVLITVTADQRMSMSWFLPPGTKKPENTDPSVTLRSKPKATVYVRKFDGTPSIQAGQGQVKTLWEALDKNCADLPTYNGAGYEPLLAIYHHNEIWIYADDINC